MFKSSILSVFVCTTLCSYLPAFASVEDSNPSALELKQLSEQYSADMDSYSSQLSQINDEQEREAKKAGDPTIRFAPKFAMLMQKHAAEPAGLDAAIWLMRSENKNVELKTEALKLLTERYAESDKIKDVIQNLKRGTLSGEGAMFLRAVRGKNPSKELKGFATLILAQKLIVSAPAESEALFEDIVKNYSDTKNLGKQKGSLVDIANNNLFEMRHLLVGKEAPEIEGVDENGKPLRLSDYRGKVILLTFWGDW